MTLLSVLVTGVWLSAIKAAKWFFITSIARQLLFTLLIVGFFAGEVASWAI